jgi:hypothetical protein
MLIAAAILTNLGVIFSFYGIVWKLWDNKANGPLYFLLSGLCCLAIGELIRWLG